MKFSTEQKEYVIDEKAAVRYPNGLPTFLFELSYEKDGKVKEGGFSMIVKKQIDIF